MEMATMEMKAALEKKNSSLVHQTNDVELPTVYHTQASLMNTWVIYNYYHYKNILCCTQTSCFNTLHLNINVILFCVEI